MSLIGKKLDDYNVPAYIDGKFKNITLEETHGKWGLYFFYPGDFTFVCPTELEDLANNYPEFQKVDCEVYAVSTDSEFVHKAWQDASPTIKKIKYPMLSDRSFVLSRFFGVLIEEEGQSLRGSFIVNPEGVIVSYEVNDLGIGRNAKELLRKVKASQFVAKHGDQVCPANWEPGEDTLVPGIDLVGKI